MPSNPSHPSPGSLPFGDALVLRDGFAVDLAVLALALRLEAAGCPIEVDRAGHLRPIPPTCIPRADRRLVSTHWSALARLVAYAIGLSRKDDER